MQICLLDHCVYPFLNSNSVYYSCTFNVNSIVFCSTMWFLIWVLYCPKSRVKRCGAGSLTVSRLHGMIGWALPGRFTGIKPKPNELKHGLVVVILLLVTKHVCSEINLNIFNKISSLTGISKTLTSHIFNN